MPSIANKKKGDTSPVLKLFETLGCEFPRVNGSTTVQAVACPFCGGDRFYVNAVTSQYQCKRGSCAAKGNSTTFIREMHAKALAETDQSAYVQMKNLRGIAIQTLKRHALAYEPAVDRWLIPFRNEAGEVVNLEQYYWHSKQKPNKYQLPGLRTSLYGLDQLSKRKDKLVLLCEGALDAIAVDAYLGVGARGRYAVIGSPGPFKAEWAELLRGRKVRTLYDNDDAGREHTKHVEKVLGESRIASELQVLDWPEGLDGYDMTDLLKAEPDLSIPEWTQQHSRKYRKPSNLIFYRAHELDDDSGERIEWVWPNHMRTKTYISFSGWQGTYKSTCAIDLVARYTAGREMPDGSIGLTRGHVLYMSAEDDVHTVRKHVKRMGGDLEKLFLMPAIGLDESPVNVLDYLQDMEDMIRQYRIRFVVIDGQNSVVGAPDISTDMKARHTVSNRLHQFAQRMDIALVGIRNEDREGRALGAQSMGDIARCIVRSVDVTPLEMQKAGKVRYLRLEFPKVSDAAKSTHLPIPFRVLEGKGNEREIEWNKSLPAVVKESLGAKTTAQNHRADGHPHKKAQRTAKT